MSKQLAIITEVEYETPKAYLVSANGKCWLPKSHTNLHKVSGIEFVEIPTWLWMKNRNILSIRTSAETLREQHGYFVEE